MINARRTLHGAAAIVGAALFGGMLATTSVARAEGSTPDEALKKLDELIKRGDANRPKGTKYDKVATEKDRAAVADRFYEAAKKKFEAVKYAEALELIEKAVEANPKHAKAKALADELRALLRVRTDWVNYAIEQFSREKRVQIQESLVNLRKTLNEGKRHVHSAREQDVEASGEILLSRQIRELERAIDKFKRVSEIIKWMPYQVNLAQTDRETKDLLASAQRELAGRQEDLRVERRVKAKALALKHRNDEAQIVRGRFAQLVAMAKVSFDQGDFDKCEDVCDTILKNDPTNREAKDLRSQSRSERHALREEELYTRDQHERQLTLINIEEAAIPYSDRIRYPKNWEDILRRVEKAGTIEQTEQPEWSREIERKLERKVSFEFSETPLTEAVTFLQTLTKVNIIIDPESAEQKGSTPITLKVTNMTLRLALDWILKLADLDYALSDYAIFVSERENLKGNVTLRIYDVRDLTEKVPNFPGPDLMLEVGGSGSSGGAPGLMLIDADMNEDEVTADSLAEMIEERVRPGEWDDALGTSIEQRSGKLVVMQRPEVHRLIARLLESFRASQKLLVTVEARFLEIREGFFEEIGVDFGRIPDFYGPGGPGAGGLAPAGTYLPNNGPAGANWPVANEFGYEQLIVDEPGTGGYISSSTLSESIFGGIVLKPRQVDIFGDGQMHVIGAVANYRPNTSPEQTMIGSGLNTGTLLEQGLNAQIRHIGNIEVMAFLHALKVREGGTQLSAPRLTVTNTQRAHMFIAEQQSYIADYEISGDSWDPVIRQFLQGTVFDVKPIVSADRRYITLELRPTTAALLRMPEIVITSTSILDGNSYTLDFPIQFPELELRKVRTTVTIPDGGIIMLGGMMSDIKFQSESGVPFLSNIPVIGKLFRWNTTDNERRNLSVLVTGRILLFDEEENKR
jgi:general secretion pathway protein D